MELALGTANFGSVYGVLDSGTKLDQPEINEVLQVAVNLEVTHLDMAIGYGEIEKIISASNTINTHRKFTTKVGIEIVEGFDELRTDLLSRINTLGISMFENILLHDSALLNNKIAIYNLMELQNSGLTKTIGASIYEESELYRCMDLSESLKFLQLPLNVLTRNRFKIYQLEELARNGVSIQARSIFLQGLLLNPAGKLPAKLAGIRPILMKFHELCLEQRTNPVDVLTSFIKVQHWCHGAVIGVNSALQLREIWESFQRDISLNFDFFPILDSWLQDPRNWKIT